MEISSSAPTSLPTGKPVPVFNLLSGYVELQQPATPGDISILIESKPSATSLAALQDLADGCHFVARGEEATN